MKTERVILLLLTIMSVICAHADYYVFCYTKGGTTYYLAHNTADICVEATFSAEKCLWESVYNDENSANDKYFVKGYGTERYLAYNSLTATPYDYFLEFKDYDNSRYSKNRWNAINANNGPVKYLKPSASASYLAHYVCYNDSTAGTAPYWKPMLRDDARNQRAKPTAVTVTDNGYTALSTTVSGPTIISTTGSTAYTIETPELQSKTYATLTSTHFGGTTYYAYDNGTHTTLPVDWSNTDLTALTTTWSLANADGLATVDASTGELTVTALPAITTDVTLSCTVSIGVLSQTLTKTITLEAGEQLISSLSEITSASGKYQLRSDFSTTGTARVGGTADGAEIGTSANPFRGTIDGRFVTIEGTWNKPLFNCIKDATIKNVVVSRATISGGVNTGAFCNVADGTSRIYNCGVLGGSISGSGAVGGLVGKIQSGSDSRVVNCYNFAAVSGGSHAAGIVGRNDGANARIALCMMYGDVTGATVISPVYSGTHTRNVSNYSEYNYYRSKANVPYTLYNDQSAIDKDEYLTRFPFYRHILNTHRCLASYFLFGNYDAGNVEEIGHWVLNTQTAAYPIVEDWQTNTKRTTSDINDNLPMTTADYAGRLLTDMGSGGYLTVNVSINGSTYSSQLPITDMDTLRYDYTWGKVVLPFANEYSGWTRNYSKVCTGWKITSVTGGTEGTFQNYNMTDRDCTAKDLYSNSGYIFAQGGYYVVPYGVTAISIEAHFANAFYLSDPTYETGFTTNYATATPLGDSVPESYHGQTVYTSLVTLVADLAETNSPHDQAIVLVGNYHFNVTSSTNGFNVRKAVTIMSTDEDCNQEPDYGWYTSNAQGRLEVPALRFDFVPNIEMGMAARVTGTSRYPGIGIWHARGWFELTETCVSIMSQCEINSSDFLTTDNGKGNNRWIANSGCFVQIVRARDNRCTKLSYIQIGGNAYVEELYPGSHTDTARDNVIVPIVVTGGEVKECFMSGYAAGGKLTGDMIRFWCTGGKLHKFLGCYMEEPVTAGLTAKIDHALICRFFGGGTSSSARIKGDIDVTINNSKVDFYCGGPEFGDMYSGKTVTTRANNTTFGNYYGAGFGGTSVTYVRNEQMINAISAATMTYPIPFTEYTSRRLNARDDNSIANCYKFEYIYHSNGYQTVARYYTGYALFSLATTGSVTNLLTDCHILGDFYGAGCQGKVSGTVTSTLTGCTLDGDAYGGGYKAVSNEVNVYTVTQPTYSVYTRETGIFSGFGTVQPDTYTWQQGTAGTSIEADKVLYTNVAMSDLGNVTGDISLTIDSCTVAADVYGGGNESKSLSNTSVKILNNAVIDGNVYGGGNQAEVLGSTYVQIGERQ